MGAEVDGQTLHAQTAEASDSAALFSTRWRNEDRGWGGDGPLTATRDIPHVLGRATLPAVLDAAIRRLDGHGDVPGRLARRVAVDVHIGGIARSRPGGTPAGP